LYAVPYLLEYADAFRLGLGLLPPLDDFEVRVDRVFGLASLVVPSP